MNKEISKILIAGTEYDIRDSRFKELTELEEQVSAKEDVANKVTSINADADDVHYPSAKAVREIVGDVESVLRTING